MNKRVLIPLIAITALIVGALSITVYSHVNTPTKPEIFRLVNAERAKVGAPDLKEDPKLNASAQMKADDMVKYGYFDHISPSTSPYAGQQGYTLIDSVGANCVYRSENIHQGTIVFNRSEDVVWRWMNSKAHKDALLDKRYTLTGIGISGNYVVQHFCQTN
jgi:uncharacterized protein YkwD